MNFIFYGLGEWEQKVVRKKLEGEFVGSMEMDVVEKEVFFNLNIEECEVGYLDMLVEMVLFRVDIDFGVINRCDFYVVYFVEVVLVNVNVLY